jgi:hypothetical protein
VALWDRLTGAVAGIAVSRAGGTAIAPVLEPLRQDAWKRRTPRVLDVEMLASLVGQGYLTIDDAVAEAARNGYSPGRMQAVAQYAMHGASVAEALVLWRRTAFDHADAGYREHLVNHALAKAAIEPQYWDAIKLTRDDPLTPDQIAVAIQRSLIPNQGQLPFDTTVPAGRIQPMPVTHMDAYAAAAVAAVGRDELDVMTRSVGLPPGMDLIARLVFRDVLEHADFMRGAAESNRRLEWAAAEFEAYRQIPSVADYINAELRGHISLDAMHDGAARHGMSKADADLILVRSGRPPTVRQAIVGFRRGARVDGFTETERAYAAQAVRQADLRPQWIDVEYAANQGYPSLFVLNRLVAAGVVNAETAREWVFKSGMAPEVVSALHTYWASSGVSTGDPHVGKAENQLWATQHTSYKNGESDAADVETTLDLLGVPQGVHARIVNLWNRERHLTRKTLTQAQLKKAYKEGLTNPATGQPWTSADARARLVESGLDQDDATTVIETWG